jgi:hypothetical protein
MTASKLRKLVDTSGFLNELVRISLMQQRHPNCILLPSIETIHALRFHPALKKSSVFGRF